jgi:hypothetical protein
MGKRGRGKKRLASPEGEESTEPTVVPSSASKRRRAEEAPDAGAAAADATPKAAPKKRASPKAKATKRGSRQRGAKVVKDAPEEAETETTAPSTPTSAKIKSTRGRKRQADEVDDAAELLASPSRAAGKRQRADDNTTDVRVCFSGIESAVAAPHEKMVTALGGVVVDDVLAATHLYRESLSRTRNTLRAIGSGKFVVGKAWLQGSVRANAFVDGDAHSTKDKAFEKKHHFSLQDSLRKARESPLFAGLTFYVTKGCKPPPTEMASIIKAAGGTVAKSTAGSGDIHVITCEADLSSVKVPASRTAHMLSNEFVLAGVLKQEVDVDAHSLDEPAAAAAVGKSKRGRRGGK